MSKKSQQLELRPLKTNLLQQNCYVRDVTVNSSSNGVSVDSFESVDEVVTEKGVELVYSTNDYPITPQSVNSYVDSVDYRRDPVAAVANGHQRQNLGDITDVQKIAAMDMESARALYAQLSEKLGKVSKQEPVKQESVKQESVKQEPKGE